MIKPATIIRSAVCCAGLVLTQPLLAAQSDAGAGYPTKPVRFIVPFTPGAGTNSYMVITGPG